MAFNLNKFQICNQKGAFNDDFRAVQLSGRSVTTYTEAKKGRGKEDGGQRERKKGWTERERKREGA